MTTSSYGWSVDVVRVVPHGADPPSRDVVGALRAAEIVYSERLDGPGGCTVEFLPGTVTPVVAELVADPFHWTDFEIRCPDGALRWAGTYHQRDSDPEQWTVAAASHEQLLAGAGLYADLPGYVDVDQTAILQAIIDHHQAVSHKGIDTSTVTPSGVLRTRSSGYYKLHEAGHVGELARNLGQVDNGFDWHITPDRRLVTHYPQRGTDRSANVVLAGPQIRDAEVAASAAIEDCVSEVLAIGTPEDTEAEPLLSLVYSPAADAVIGRRRLTIQVDGVSSQATLEAHARRALASHAGALFVPSGALLPVAGSDLDGWQVGDTIGWEAPSGLGIETFARRVVARTVTVSADGVTQQVEFA